MRWAGKEIFQDSDTVDKTAQKSHLSWGERNGKRGSRGSARWPGMVTGTAHRLRKLVESWLREKHGGNFSSSTWPAAQIRFIKWSDEFWRLSRQIKKTREIPSQIIAFDIVLIWSSAQVLPDFHQNPPLLSLRHQLEHLNRNEPDNPGKGKYKLRKKWHERETRKGEENSSVCFWHCAWRCREWKICTKPFRSALSSPSENPLSPSSMPIL